MKKKCTLICQWFILVVLILGCTNNDALSSTKKMVRYLDEGNKSKFEKCVTSELLEELDEDDDYRSFQDFSQFFKEGKDRKILLDTIYNNTARVEIRTEGRFELYFVMVKEKNKWLLSDLLWDPIISPNEVNPLADTFFNALTIGMDYRDVRKCLDSVENDPDFGFTWYVNEFANQELMPIAKFLDSLSKDAHESEMCAFSTSSYNDEGPYNRWVINSNVVNVQFSKDRKLTGVAIVSSDKKILKSK